MFATPDMAYMAKLAWAYGNLAYSMTPSIPRSLFPIYISMIGVITSDPVGTLLHLLSLL